MIRNFLHHSDEIREELKGALRSFFNSETLILNDTRLLIIPEVLPHIPFVGWYDQRILPILSDTNFALSDPFYDDILHYFQRLGLSENVHIHSFENNPSISLTENILSNPSFIEELKQRNYKTLINFSVDSRVEQLASAIGAECIVSSVVSNQANDKWLLKKFLSHADLPTIEGVYTSDANVIREYFERKEHYFFKSPHGVSGYGFWSNQKNSLEDILSQYNGIELIIERVIEKESSPSIQFCIYENDGVKNAIIFGFTDQILEGWQHYLGNESPSIYFKENKEITRECLRQSEKIIEYIMSLGYVWFGGIDFMVSTEKQVYASEVNARFTGATYPAITSFLLSWSLVTPWKYITHEWVTGSITEHLEKSIQNPEEYGTFPLCIAPLEKYWRTQILTIWLVDEHDI